MSGHSHWSTIRHQKEVEDAKKGKIFAKLSRGIIIAVREGGGKTDPEDNPRLRVAIDQAKEANMPKDKIKSAIMRAVGRGAGEKGIEKIIFGGFFLDTALLIKGETNNKNRTTSQVRSILEKYGGKMASHKAVEPYFDSSGKPQFTIPLTDEKSKAKLEKIIFQLEQNEDISKVYTNAA